MNGLLRWSFVVSVVVGICFPLSSCSTIPKEVVELSYRMGEDMEAIQTSYKRLVHDHFDALRKERIRYLDDVWTPNYIRAWVKDGRLRDVAKGDIIWSEEKDDFTKPVPGQEELGLLTTVTFWSMAAVQEIQGKRAKLLDPLDKQEEQLSSWIDDAFNRLYRGNATITAHLNSLRKVQEVQDDALSALNLKDLRDKINSTLVTASDKAKEGLEAVKKVDGMVQDFKKKLPQKTGSN